MTKQEIKDFKPAVEMIKTAQEVFLNMARVETIKPIVEKIQNEVLKENGFKCSVFNTYTLSDKSFKIYLKDCRKEFLKIKLIDESFNKDFCPLLVAENDLREAENKLINTVCEELKNKLDGVTSEQITRSFKHRRNFIELNLKYLSQFLK